MRRWTNIAMARVGDNRTSTSPESVHLAAQSCGRMGRDACCSCCRLRFSFHSKLHVQSSDVQPVNLSLPPIAITYA